MTEASSFQSSFLLADDSTGKVLKSGTGRDFLCDPSHWAHIFPGRLTPRLADLLRIATAAYVADRITPRDRSRAEIGWTRSLRLQIEVFDHDFWSYQEIRDRLQECLEFVSGDLWEIGFTHARMQFGIGFLPFTKQWQPLDSNPIICLYSGGLDSAAGLVRRIGEVSSQEIVPLLVRHQSSQEIQVEGQILAIKLAKGIELRPLILPFWMQQPEKLAKEETTQRSRSFLFCSAGGVAGAILHAEAIELMESGIGAINVPLMTGMVGSKATHSSHPSFLKSFSELLNMVADREIAVRLPHLFLTKAELVKSLVDAGLAELIGKTSSCVHYPLRDPEVRQCGICPACIFRRQAIWAAGAKDQDREYEYDLFSAASGSIPAKKMGDIKAFLWQVEKLSPLDHSNQLPDFVLRHLRATGLTSNVDPPSDAVIDLCRRYRREWMALLEVGLREEWAWTKMMGPVPATVI